MSTDKQKLVAAAIMADWAKIRAKGKFRFVFVDGVLKWGLPTGILYFLIMTAFDYFYFEPNFQFSPAKLLARLAITLFIWSLVSSISDWLLWNKREKEFSKNK